MINPRIDRTTPVIVQGITGRAGRLHTRLMKEYGTNIVAGVSPRSERRDVDRVKQPAVYPEGSIPLTDGKPGVPEQVAEVVLFLASERSSHVNGTEIWIDGGQSLVEG